MANSSSQTMIGMLFLTLAQFLWNTNDVIVKFISSELPLTQILLAEHTLGLIFSIIWWQCKTPENIEKWYGDQPYRLNIWIRSFFHFSSTAIYFWSITIIPLGDATCFFFYSPLLTILLAHIFLNEKLPNIWILILSSLLTICGMLLAYQPQFITNLFLKKTDVHPLNIYGVAASLLSGLSWTFACLLTRCAKTSHVLQLETVNSFQSVILWIPALSMFNRYIFQNETIGDIFDFDLWQFNAYSLGILLIIAILGYSGTLFMTLGYQFGDATKISWLEYIVIAFAFGYQILFFNDIPSIYQTIGAMIVTVGCLLPVLEEIYNGYKYHKYLDVSDSETSASDSDV